MKVIKVRNVQEALPAGLEYLDKNGVRRDSRNGPVVVAPGPVTTYYQRPMERVIFWPERDANPFFHLFESLWMLAGRDDVAFLTQFVKRMSTFSDDGKTLHGAYGYRWLQHFQVIKEETSDGITHGWAEEIDQLSTIIYLLKADPEDRRCVLQMWDCSVDLGRDGKDVPCNTQAYFSINGGGALDMTVCCRSNDIIWGAYGANAVHFSILQEYIAAGVGVPVGGYWQISNNYHAYDNKELERLRPLIDRAPDPLRTTSTNHYACGVVEPFPLVSTPLDQWRQDLLMFLDEGVVLGLREPFFRKVANPMLMAHRAFKENGGSRRYEIPREILGQAHQSDWVVAATEWIERRRVKFEEATDAD